MRSFKFIIMNDLKDKEDVKLLVDTFYDKVRIDPIIGAVFAARIANDQWPSHLEKMYSFWHTVLFAVRDYHGNPFSKHASLPIQARHFDRWLTLFNETVDELFSGVKANEAKSRAYKMGQLFQSKLAHIQSNDQYRNIM